MKPLNVKSRWILDRINKHVESYNIRGPLDRFRDVASDVLDGAVVRSELAELLRRRLLTLVHHGFDDSMGKDPFRFFPPDQCGTSWSVNPTDRLIRLLWPHRLIKESRPRALTAKEGS